MPAEKIGERITARLGQSSLPELARRCGVHLPTLVNIVQGKTLNPGVATVAPIALALGMTIDELYYGDERPESPVDLFWRRLSLNGSAALADLLAGRASAGEDPAVAAATVNTVRAGDRGFGAARPPASGSPDAGSPKERPRSPDRPYNRLDTRSKRAR